MSPGATEREPLLSQTAKSNGGKPADKTRLGPLDLSRSTRYKILAGMWMGSFFSALNQTLVPTMLPSISSEFNKSNQASWLGTSYLLATCTFTPLHGRLCNVLGRKGANHTALFFAGLGVLLCGLSTNLETLVLARFLTGIGGGGLMIFSRGLTQGVQSVFVGLGTGLGGPLGGLINDWLGWRWAFLVQIPVFLFSYLLTSSNLIYVTEGKGKTAKEILKRIDYGGSASLMMAVGSCLLFLSAKYNEGLPWLNTLVIAPAIFAVLFLISFILVELFVAPEPVLAPTLLKQPISVLVGMSNFLVASCNFSIVCFLPMWFQTVILTSASTAGLHLLPNSICVSLGSLFAGWVIRKTGRYKMISLIFGVFPFVGAWFIYQLQVDSGFWVSWFSIVPLGFGNSVIQQTTLRKWLIPFFKLSIINCFLLVALLVHLQDDQIAVGTGFGQLWRGVGQVGGVAISSAVFQSKLESELRKHFLGTGSEALIKQIRQNAKFVATLPLAERVKAQEAYKVSLKSVFFFAACMTLIAYVVRLPIPDKSLDSIPKRARGRGGQGSQEEPNGQRGPGEGGGLAGSQTGRLASTH